MIILECTHCRRNVEFKELDDAHGEVITQIAKNIICTKCGDLLPHADNLDRLFKTEPIHPEWTHYENELVAQSIENESLCVLFYSDDPKDHVEACRYIVASYEGPGNVILGSHADISDRLNILASHEEDLMGFRKKLLEAAVLCITGFGEGRMGESGDPPSTKHFADLLECRLATADTTDAVYTAIGTSHSFPGLQTRCNEFGTKTLGLIKNHYTLIK